ncbi:DNA polymerase epsilon subunit B [Porphyridium purpureum]|uniref:DNA polymerase II subunit 2 n=1 Tax=Porphyridium purpureum TaxID=35688 RepID=A0A5J4YP47_PORPP|nr:DNA polymerase epsilon subunit B [Porphyridium purpureum]|eukprot:POR9351..scf222_8
MVSGEAAQLRRALLRSCKMRGFVVQSDAVELMSEAWMYAQVNRRAPGESGSEDVLGGKQLKDFVAVVLAQAAKEQMAGGTGVGSRGVLTSATAKRALVQWLGTEHANVVSGANVFSGKVNLPTADASGAGRKGADGVGHIAPTDGRGRGKEASKQQEKAVKSTAIGNAMQQIGKARVAKTNGITKELVLEARSLDKHRRKGKHLVQVVDSQDMPIAVFSSDRTGRIDAVVSTHHEKAALLHAQRAQAKTRMWLARYYLLLGRVQRHPVFARIETSISRVWHAHRTDKLALTKIQGLICGDNGTKYLFGMLSLRDEHSYALEDDSGSVSINLDLAQTDGSLITESSFVLVEGCMKEVSEAFHVRAICQPPLEDPQLTMEGLKGLNLFGGIGQVTNRGAAAQPDVSPQVMLVLGGCHLDTPETFSKLKKLLQNLTAANVVPAVIVLMGSFLSFPLGRNMDDAEMLEMLFSKLGTMVFARFPLIARSTSLVLVPGSNDMGVSGIMPLCPVPEYMVAGLRKTVPDLSCTTNPSRILLGERRVVLYEDDVAHASYLGRIFPTDACIDIDALTAEKNATAAAMPCQPNPFLSQLTQQTNGPSQAGRAPGLQLSSDEAPRDFNAKRIQSMLHQSHLCPLPLRIQPISWQMDHAMWLLPQPDGLIVASCPGRHWSKHTTSQSRVWEYQSSVIMEPGSFARDGTYLLYSSSDNSATLETLE